MKVLFLDWYKTLSNSLFWEQTELSDPAKFEKITYSCFVKQSHLIQPWMRGEYSSEEIAVLISKDTKISKKYILKELQKSASNMEFSDKEIPVLINKIRNKGIKTVIATDNMDTLIRWTAPALKLSELFDEVLSSWDLKALKSDFYNNKSQFFKSFFKSNSWVKPFECTIMDDAEDRDKRISNYGINYLRIKSTDDFVSKLRSLI